MLGIKKNEGTCKKSPISSEAIAIGVMVSWACLGGMEPQVLGMRPYGGGISRNGAKILRDFNLYVLSLLTSHGLQAS